MNSNALSFYRFKQFGTCPNHFDPSKLFLTGTNVLDMAQNVKYSSEKLLLDRSKRSGMVQTIWTDPK